MTLSSTIDPKARVTLTCDQSGVSYQWYKDGVLFGTTGAPSIVDHRPNKRYVYVPAQDASNVFTGSWADSYNAKFYSTGGNAKKTVTVDDQVTINLPPCVEFGIVLCPAVTSSHNTNIGISLDGTDQGTIVGDIKSGRVQASTIRWGKSGLTLTGHTVTLTLQTGASLTFDGYWYSDRNVPLGTSVTYAVSVDGGAQQTVVVTPAINRAAVLSGVVDQIGTVFANYPSSLTNGDGYAWNEYVGALSMAYLMTGREELRNYATTLYNGYLSRIDADKVLTYSTFGRHIVLNGRTGYNYWLAYKIFGDSKYLTILDEIVGVFRNTWPRHTVAYNGTNYPNVWDYSFDSGGAYVDGNQWSTPALSCALAYNEPSSAYYHDAQILSLIKANVDWAYAVYNPATGELSYADGNDATWNCRSYGVYEWIALQYVADTLGYRTADATKVLNWLNSYDISEPWFFDDTAYDTTPSAEITMWQTGYIYRKNGSVPSEFVDRAYSAALVVQPMMTYNPAGAPEGTPTMDSLLWRYMFWGAISSYLFNAPLAVYGAAAAPSAPAILNADGSVGGQILNIDGSDGAAIQDL